MFTSVSLKLPALVKFSDEKCGQEREGIWTHFLGIPWKRGEIFIKKSSRRRRMKKKTICFREGILTVSQAVH